MERHLDDENQGAQSAGAFCVVREEEGMGGLARYGLLALVGGTVVVAGGCAKIVDDPATSPGFESSVVSVENNKWLDVNVFAVRAGRRARLGMVTSMTTRVFKLPSWTMIGTGELRLLIDPVGSPATHLTDPILVMGGERVELRVENVLAMSAYSVRSRR
jgi:hypothetical protein